MKHYCNRRTPQSNREIKQPDIRVSAGVLNEENEVVLPPGSDGTVFEELGKRVITYGEELNSTEAQGGSVTQCSGLGNSQRCEYMVNQSVFADNLSGEFDTVSVPEYDNNLSGFTMADYVSKYIGKYICLDLWSSDSRKGEKCGILVATGQDFVVIQNIQGGEISMIDLESVKYISIYCR